MKKTTIIIEEKRNKFFVVDVNGKRYGWESTLAKALDLVRDNAAEIYLDSPDVEREPTRIK